MPDLVEKKWMLCWLDGQGVTHCKKRCESFQSLDIEKNSKGPKRERMLTTLLPCNHSFEFMNYYTNRYYAKSAFEDFRTMARRLSGQE